MTKEEQRRIVKFEVATMEEHDRKTADAKIIQNILSLSVVKSAKAVFIFLSASGEPDTITLVGELIKAGKKVGVPKCVGNDMKIIEVDEECDFKVGAFGLIEPVSEKELSRIDVVLAPLVAYDKSLNRLGKGKGYYDRYFASTKAVKVGVAYSCQEVESVVTDSNDQKLDFVVTENGLLKKMISSIREFDQNS
ncbi:MAG: 5-formyltetrahydrofolate cyclo-ligase [Clostridia bacterium]|nr:5-formyltetrahydrofolate cyclo-ligase [Clostridia bacterium]